MSSYQLICPTGALNTHYQALLPTVYWIWSTNPSQDYFRIEPGDEVPIVRWHNERPTADSAYWGYWPPGPQKARRAAPAERVLADPYFRDQMSGRCLIPATAWHEGPQMIQHALDGVRSFAGVWTERPRHHSQRARHSFAIVTTWTDDKRCPLVLDSADYLAWLDPATPNPDEILLANSGQRMIV